jgi:hypothetical protein
MSYDGGGKLFVIDNKQVNSYNQNINILL